LQQHCFVWRKNGLKILKSFFAKEPTNLLLLLFEAHFQIANQSIQKLMFANLSSSNCPKKRRIQAKWFLCRDEEQADAKQRQKQKQVKKHQYEVFSQNLSTNTNELFSHHIIISTPMNCFHISITNEMFSQSLSTNIKCFHISITQMN
jgi:hypothetical protein